MHILVILLSLLSMILLIHNTILQKKNELLHYSLSVLVGHIFDERGEEYLKKLMK
ncbi:hypothetical protein MTR12_10980 [Staphylococcus agnetis]|uniref:hypothetical protein n=1 Tax=Staphylococcus TaxID=1279 RepID=UPI00208F220F|nr:MULTISPECIES: hypothetical protein [Staphylococcus]MCO4330315.1 hypothetical protein [Staphylococcus hyicus]MCO4335839.1 hypothetical protein [Staphylococcus hyicus]MCO4339756.1 hypothetical protein [Staphylococcus agnetis]MCO4356075.1 hypothetical protein [Staphylococcus agnetis]